MFSTRASIDAKMNRLGVAQARLKRAGESVLDLTLSNPTRAGLDYPSEEIGAALAAASGEPYAPDPLGIRSAREAVAAHLSGRGEEASPDDIVITASTSEAYSFLFKLLGDAGSAILTPRPAYPLLDHLAAIESCRLEHFELELDGGRWSLSPAAVERAITPQTRAVVVVHPNNPTGSYLSGDEMIALAEVCARRGVPLVSDEVFFDFPLEARSSRAPSAASLATGCLTFALGGLSKSCGLPQLKLGWIRVAGPEELKKRAVRGLEMIADNFLSVATPVQVALPELLRIGAAIGDQIRSRTGSNLEMIRGALAETPAVEALPVEGGWSAVLRVPRIVSDEDFALHLLEWHRLVVHPGYFFDFDREGFVVVSLLPRTGDLSTGLTVIRDVVRELVGDGAPAA